MAHYIRSIPEIKEELLDEPQGNLQIRETKAIHFGKSIGFAFDLRFKSIYGRESSDIREPNILTVKEAESLLDAARTHLDLDLLAAVTLGLFCGIRTEELKKLEWKDIRMDEKQPFVVISSRIAKKRRIRNVDIPPNALTWLKVCRKKSGAVARNEYISDYQKRFRNLQRLAGFGEWIQKGDKRIWKSTWKENSIRHSFGSYHYALHGDSMLTSRLMGHKEGDAVLFEHYRALVSSESAEKFFNLKYYEQSKMD